LIVVDASVVFNIVSDDGPEGTATRALLGGLEMSVPDLVDVEVTSILRGHWLVKRISARRFAQAIEDLADLPAERYPVLQFMQRAYELRSNVTPYDAAYVALAEALGCELVTADARLARAAGPRCPITVLQ
jgi:predicted nucleic acid-binding protein